MIDIENILLDKIYKAVRAAYPTASIYPEPVPVPESFPCVTVWQSDSASYGPTYAFDSRSENHALVTFEVNVYDNDAVNKRANVKTIFDIVDRVFQENNFTRSLAMPTPNVDRTVFRMTGRYDAIVGKAIAKEVDGQTVYTYPVHRRI